MFFQLRAHASIAGKKPGKQDIIDWGIVWPPPLPEKNIKRLILQKFYTQSKHVKYNVIVL